MFVVRAHLLVLLHSVSHKRDGLLYAFHKLEGHVDVLDFYGVGPKSGLFNPLNWSKPAEFRCKRTLCFPALVLFFNAPKYLNAVTIRKIALSVSARRIVGGQHRDFIERQLFYELCIVITPIAIVGRVKVLDHERVRSLAIKIGPSILDIDID